MRKKIWIFLLSLCFIFSGLVSSSIFAIHDSSRNDDNQLSYLVPKGTKGWCYLIWEDPRANPLPKKDNEYIVRFNKKGIAQTSTSQKPIQYKIYYIEKNGQKTEIPDYYGDTKKDIIYRSLILGGGMRNGVGVGDQSIEGPEVDYFFLGTPEEIKNEEAKTKDRPYPEEADQILYLKADKAYVQTGELSAFDQTPPGLGTTKRNLVKVWGKPDKIVSGNYVYTKKKVEYSFSSNGKVVQLKSTHKKYTKLVARDVKAILGKPDHENKRVLSYYSKRYALTFKLLQNKVVEVTVKRR